jgi:hypothetical protein
MTDTEPVTLTRGQLKGLLKELLRPLLRPVRLISYISVVMLVAVGVAVLAVRQEAIDRTSAITASRADARAAACAQDNIRIDQHNALADSLQHILDTLNVPNPNRTPDQQAKADAFFVDARAAVDRSRVAARDCSPAGLDAYYSPKPGG